MAVETHYARRDDLHIAYQVTGEGPQTLVFLPGFASHLEHQWKEPSQAAFFKRLSSFCRLIRIDKRGQGLSDRTDQMPSVEDRMGDLAAVLDAVGCDKVSLLTLSEGGPLGLMWASTYPERTEKLILWNTQPRMIWSPEYDTPNREEIVSERLREYRTHWGTGYFVSRFVPSQAGSRRFKKWWSEFERLTMSPGTCAEAMRAMYKTDLRDLLPSVAVPTLVMRNSGDVLTQDSVARYTADKLPDARMINLPGEDHFGWRIEHRVTAEVEEFITGRPAHEQEYRKLATILMLDIVESTQQSIALGDRAWSELLDDFDAEVLEQLQHFRGKLIDQAGDGLFATFESPSEAIQCATAIRAGVDAQGLQLRIGIHAGEVESRGDRLAGIAVHIAVRISSLAGIGEIWVSGTIKDLVVGSDLQFRSRGQRELKGVPEAWELFSVVQNSWPKPGPMGE